MTNKEKYAKFCGRTYVPIYSKPWWMDAVCGAENWDVWLYEKGGAVKAAMPFYKTTKNGYNVITKASNTQNNGIIFDYEKLVKIPARLSFEEKVINAACDYIETLNLDKYEQQFHYSFKNWLPFFWRYYDAIVRYTYVIDTTNSYEKIESNFTAKVRNEIRKAEKLVRLVERDLEISEFFQINEMSFMRQGKQTPYDLEFVSRIYNACQINGAGRILAAETQDGTLCSVAFLVWDEKSLYYLLNGTDPQYRATQANYFLIREAIKLAKELGKNFDFEGSVIQPIEKAFREFGGTPMPYFRVSKVYNSTMLKDEMEEKIKQLKGN